jgi:hypothetical protein
MGDLTVQRDDEGLYVEIEGRKFRGEDLPAECTWISSASTFTDFNRHQVADIEWSGETPSGRCQATLRES